MLPYVMRIHREILSLKTRREFDVVDITTDVEKAVVDAGVEEGFAIVYSPHTTCAVLINERETGLLADLRRTLSGLIPVEDNYLHDDFDVRTENLHPGETKNAHAHLWQMLSGRVSECVTIAEGTVRLGQWQRIMIVELDRARDREILIQVCGA